METREIAHALVRLNNDNHHDSSNNNSSTSNSKNDNNRSSNDNSNSDINGKAATPSRAPSTSSPSPSLVPRCPSAEPSPSPCLPSGREAVIMPSILAADFGKLADEAQVCDKHRMNHIRNE